MGVNEANDNVAFLQIGEYYDCEEEIKKYIKKNNVELKKLILMVELDVYSSEELIKQIKKILKNNKKLKINLKKYFLKNNF